MSFQITVLKVLAGHPGGRLSVADLTRCVSILISSGSDWTNRTKRLAARAPGLDIFSQLLVLRDSAGSQITEAGRAFLVSFLIAAVYAVLDEFHQSFVASRTGSPWDVLIDCAGALAGVLIYSRAIRNRKSKI